MNRTELRKKKKRKKKIILSILSIVLVILTGTAAYGSYLTNQAKHLVSDSRDELERGGKSDLREHKVDPMEESFSVLFIGVDQRPKKEGPTRSDALVLATFNNEKHSIKLVSIPRDSRVSLRDEDGNPTEYGMDKINHAHAHGDADNNKGIDYTIATAENLFDIPIDYYAQFDFKAFMKVVNSLNGITVDVSVQLKTQDSHDNKNAIILEPGKQKLNGEEALAYVRNRKSPGAGNDFGRGKRQMNVIKAIIDKAKSFSSITRYDDVLKSLEGHIKTNLTFSQILGMYEYADNINNINKLQLNKGENVYIPNENGNNVYYWQLNDQQVNKISTNLQEHLELKKKGSSQESTTTNQ